MTQFYILAADDEPMNRLILEELLEDDYELACVENGAECVQSVINRRPDLVLLDINMPVMDGYQACKEIKALGGCADLPIIMVSALASEKEIAKGLSCLADAYVTKPFNEEELIKAIKCFI